MVAGENSSNGVNGNHLYKIFVMKKRYLLAALLMAGFSQTFAQKSEQIKLITLDPGHFHAALVQKNMFPNVSAEVKVYAPQGKT
jgi:vacuolar-type H+-ATPase subunit F/Vma7